MLKFGGRTDGRIDIPRSIQYLFPIENTHTLYRVSEASAACGLQRFRQKNEISSLYNIAWDWPISPILYRSRRENILNWIVNRLIQQQELFIYLVHLKRVSSLFPPGRRWPRTLYTQRDRKADGTHSMGLLKLLSMCYKGFDKLNASTSMGDELKKPKISRSPDDLISISIDF